MSIPLTPREILRWYPTRWNQIAGNSHLVCTWLDMIQNGPCNTLITGPSRSGKTRTTCLGLTSMLCTNRTATMDPCLSCSSCKSTLQGRESQTGLFSIANGSQNSFVPIDCQSVTQDQLRGVLRDSRLEDVETVVYLDEVSALGRRGLADCLLKPIDESRCVWIASAINVNLPQKKGRGRKLDGLSDPMKARFSLKLSTAIPSPIELGQWVKERCQQFVVEVTKENETIPLLVEKCKGLPGIAIAILSEAAVRGRRLTPEVVHGFKLTP